jgi:hypothetical protein
VIGAEAEEQLERLRGYVRKLWPAASFAVPNLVIKRCAPYEEERDSLAVDKLCAYPIDETASMWIVVDHESDNVYWSGHGIGPCAIELTTILLRRELRKRIEPIIAAEQARRDAATAVET